MARRGERISVLCVALAAMLAVPHAGALSRNDLYPYTTPGSSVLETDANGGLLSTEIKLNTPISFYDHIYHTIFVNGNGVLSFARAMQRFFNIAFPLDDPVISPLYTHVDTRGSGTVYWSETDSPEILARAGSMIRSAFKEMADFVPTHVFLATWLDVGYYNEKSDKVNTYQVAVSSNGTHSFVEFLYPENGVQWIQGESHPSGLPDAKAQAGLMSEGRMTTLRGSGTDQIQNIDKWSNINRPGQWLYQVGPIPDGEDVIHPDNIQDEMTVQQISTCRTGASTCHGKATCIDYEVGFCCSCKEGYFGNGKSCQKNDVPLRVIGRIFGMINGIDVPSRDLQCYVQTKDGRTYTAVSRVPPEIGASFQLLNNLGGLIGWLFARPVNDTPNGYELTGGVFNHTVELTFPSTGDKVTIRTNYMGLDVFGQLKMEAEIKGTLPQLDRDTRVNYPDHDELYTRTQRGHIRSHSERICKLLDSAGENDLPFTQDQSITFQECAYNPLNADDDTTRLKFFRGVTTYEATEGIIRIAVNTKIAPLKEEDPCIQGRKTCGNHSSCVAEDDGFKCVCNPGYQYLYEEDGSATCVDVNECTAGNHMCSPDAQCINQEGGHSCQCRPGFSGDGRYCERTPTCEDTRCEFNEQCVIVSGSPTCMCLPGYEETDRGCYPATYASCDVADNCSPYGVCNFDGDMQKHVCVCMPGYVGDGYTCYSETDESTTDEPPMPQCMYGLCWCPAGWEFRNHTCIKMDGDYGETTIDYNRDLSSHPLPECLENVCICPWGYDFNRSEEICVPRPGFSHETMGPSGSHLSCNVVNRCHPYAQCIYVASTADYECRCNPGYEGDGMECTRTDECSDNTDCKENERCTYNPTNSRYECTCYSGFSMVDGHCVISDCSTNPSQCHVNAQCASTGDGGYKCMCIDGYHGDGVRQCVEDHIGCNVLFNCGRNAVCGYNQTSANFACICQPGFYGDGFTCLPQSSCRRDPSLCSPDATCVPAGETQFACVCNEGFTGDGNNCKPRPRHESNFVLVNQGMATVRIPFAASRDNQGSPIYISPAQMAIALDIDCLHGKAYSSDITGNRIIEFNYNGSMAQTFMSKVTSPEGISVDWVSRNIFWTDPGAGTVEVANLDTKKRKVLVSDGLVNPRGIAVHPYRGKLFWSDWNRQSPKLEWANEDGTGRAIFLQGEYVKLPNSLCIDWATDELCWADAGTFTISCIEIDSREISVVADQLSYPFGLAISQSHFYWTDWKTHKVEVALKSTGDRKSPLPIPPGGSGKLYGIVVIPETCPRVTNVCQYENGRCNKDQLCLPDGQGGRTCACADDASGPCTDISYNS